jgi:hypothetical protein
MLDSQHDRNDLRPAEPRHESRRDGNKAAFEPWIGNSMWAWVASVAAVTFIIAIVYGFANQDTRMAFDRNAPGPIAKLLTSGADRTSLRRATDSGSAETTGAKSPSGRSGPFPPF